MRAPQFLGASLGLFGAGAEAFELEKWWEEGHWTERVVNAKAFGETFEQVQAVLPDFKEAGYAVLNFDWPVKAGPAALYGGFGASDYLAVDPALGTEAEWKSLVAAAHKLDMKVVSWFNPSYFWTGSAQFKQAEKDVAKYGVGSSLPSDSPARWFRWKASCSSGHSKPADNNPGSYRSGRWVEDPDAGGACYYSAWSDQPSGDYAKAEWRSEITKIFQHWAGTGMDGFMLDFPQWYLCSTSGCAADVQATIVEPMHQLGVAVFGEVYELDQPELRAVLDATKDTFFDEQATAAISAGKGSGVEATLIIRDALAEAGTVPRVNPGLYGLSGKGARTLAGAMGALLGGYFANAGRDYGDFTTWAGEATLAPLLRAAAAQPALRPRGSRAALPVSGGQGGYACVRRAPAAAASAGEATETVAIVVLNLAASKATIAVDLGASGVSLPQTPKDLIDGSAGPKITASGTWAVDLPAHGYAVYLAEAGAAPPTPPPATWAKHAGANCYDGAGATSLDTESAVQMSVEVCEQLCTRTPRCTGVTVSQATYGGGHACFRRADVVVGQCEKSTEYDTYTMSRQSSSVETVV